MKEIQVEQHIRSPLSGRLHVLQHCPDPAFAQGLLGEGALLNPLAGEISAPFDGQVIACASTGHALTLRSGAGAEVLIHVGIDTVALNGAPFRMLVSEGAAVVAGQPLLRFDMSAIARAGKSLFTPVILTNPDRFRIIRHAQEGAIAAGDSLFDIVALDTIRAEAEPFPTTGAPVRREIVLPLAQGMHARPAAQLAAIARRFRAAMSLHCDGRRADPRSLASLLALGASRGSRILIEAQGQDAAEAVAAIAEGIAQGLGDPVVDLGTQQNADGAALTMQVEIPPLTGPATLDGIAAAPGIVEGQLRIVTQARATFAEEGVGEAAERERLDHALAQARAGLLARAETAGEAHAAIFLAHAELLDDPVMREDALRLLAQDKSAEFAWTAACAAIAGQLRALPDPRLRERADDLGDVAEQVVDVLQGRDATAAAPDLAGAIVAVHEMLPSQFVRLADAGMAGFCSVLGGATSHVAILAAGRGMPALVGCDPAVLTVPDGTPAILNAGKASLEIAPSEQRRAALHARIARLAANEAAALAEAALPCETGDGMRIEVMANLGSSDEARAAAAAGAEGCGLLRSEFLFLDRAGPPSADEQLAHYQAAADALPGRPLYVRTLDIGGDKPVAFMPFAPEENPALGLRGLRLTLRHPELMRPQLEALLRLDAPGRINVMLPMVISVDEIEAARTMLGEVAATVENPAQVRLGIMVETPAAAFLAPELAEHVDFFSIGTNDLAQYVLAIDRASVALAAQSDGLHPAVLRAIGAVAKAGAQARGGAGIPVSVCGSLGADPAAVPLLLGLGVRRLSVPPRRIAITKAVVRGLDLTACETLADATARAGSAAAVRALVREALPHLQDWS